MGMITDLQQKLGLKTSRIQSSEVLRVLGEVQDPDLKRDIVSLGFVKNLNIEGTRVSFDVELTTPACPVKELLKKQCEEKVSALTGVEQVVVRMTSQTRGSKITAPNIQAALGGVRNLIAVASGKGGVGKSTTAVNLAYALQLSGAKVGVLDADVYGPSIPLMTKVGMPTEQQGDLVVPPEVDGIKFVSVAMFNSAKQASILRGPMAAQIVKQFLAQIAWGELDYLLIDYPPGTGDIQLTISQVAPVTAAVIVTTPQEVALIDVRRAISMFDTMKVPVLGIIETMSYFICDECTKRHEIFRSGGAKRLSKEYGLPVLGEIPMEAAVAAGGDAGAPVVKTSTAAGVAYKSAAGGLARELALLHAKQGEYLEQFSLEWRA